jgi:hypothetical protein
VIAIADDVAFLEERANQLRALAESTPDLASELRRIADELDQQATELDGRGNTRPRGNHRILNRARSA